MDIKLFDANCSIGKRFSAEGPDTSHRNDILGIMDKKGIDMALVYHVMAKENYLMEGNTRIVEETSKKPRLLPCWVVMPHYSGEFVKPAELFGLMKAYGVKAVRVFPVYHRINLYTWLWEELFSMLAYHGIPVFIDFSNSGWSQDIDWDGIHKICSSFPGLPVVLLRQGQVADRYMYFLLDKHRNLYMETSYYQVNDGIRSLVARFGAERLVFGTGMPVYQPDCPIDALLNSGIHEDDIRKIACSNLERILGEVV
jgi:Predicted metal-dependent hydrolase of the TIM-barrel fold